MRGLTILKRAAVVLVIWGLALLQLGRAVASAVDYVQLKNEVTALDAQYQAKLEDYSGLLAEGERIRNDRDYQVELLKENYGYTEPDETPIIVRIAD
jgi:cell division protein FtsB